MIELEKMYALTAKHLRNLDAYCIVKIFSILHNAHVILRDQKIVFYVNNYIDWD